MNTLGNVATHVKNYVDDFELKGSKRDEKTRSTWAGVYIGLCAAGHEDAEWVGRVGVFLIATRGYSELDSIIRKATEAEAA
jgi:hypothetical protein